MQKKQKQKEEKRVGCFYYLRNAGPRTVSIVVVVWGGNRSGSHPKVNSQSQLLLYKITSGSLLTLTWALYILFGVGPLGELNLVFLKIKIYICLVFFWRSSFVYFASVEQSLFLLSIAWFPVSSKDRTRRRQLNFYWPFHVSKNTSCKYYFLEFKY